MKVGDMPPDSSHEEEQRPSGVCRPLYFHHSLLFYHLAHLFHPPYLYYSANLGPMLGFIYAVTTCLSIAYTWFYVGETAGRTNLELSLFFHENIPVRQWRTHVFANANGNFSKDDDQATKHFEERIEV